MPDRLVWRCDPLKSWLSLAQCDVNSTRARAALGQQKHAGWRGVGMSRRAQIALGDGIQLKRCEGCMGVATLALDPEVPEPRDICSELESRARSGIRGNIGAAR